MQETCIGEFKRSSSARLSWLTIKLAITTRAVRAIFRTLICPPLGEVFRFSILPNGIFLRRNPIFLHRRGFFGNFVFRSLAKRYTPSKSIPPFGMGSDSNKPSRPQVFFQRNPIFFQTGLFFKETQFFKTGEVFSAILSFAREAFYPLQKHTPWGGSR